MGITAKSVNCGKSHSVIIDMNDNIFSFGHNNVGQLGLNDTIDRNIPTMITNISRGDNLIIPSVLNIKSVSCGGNHTAVISGIKNK